MMSEEKAPALAAQQKALTQYLDSLLMEIPDVMLDEVVTETLVAPRVEVVVPASHLVTEEVIVDDESAEQTFDSDVKIDEGSYDIPVWGIAPFKALFFNVGETTLAAPLEKLGAVLTDCDEIKVLPGTSAYYLGVMVHCGNTIRIIDFERFVAESSGAEMNSSAAGLMPPNRIILIEGEGIGIACRDVAEVEEIDPSTVRWRSGKSSRPWYRGIVVEKMCALLDIDMLMSVLNDDANH